MTEDLDRMSYLCLHVQNIYVNSISDDGERKPTLELDDRHNNTRPKVSKGVIVNTRYNLAYDLNHKRT
jgi:hypothetical protein